MFRIRDSQSTRGCCRTGNRNRKQTEASTLWWHSNICTCCSVGKSCTHILSLHIKLQRVLSSSRSLYWQQNYTAYIGHSKMTKMITVVNRTIGDTRKITGELKGWLWRFTAHSHSKMILALSLWNVLWFYWTLSLKLKGNITYYFGTHVYRLKKIKTKKIFEMRIKALIFCSGCPCQISSDFTAHFCRIII